MTVGLLIVSNTFMTFAWYGHLKMQSLGWIKSWPLFAVILLSWGIALLEYCFMVPANRMGYVENGGPFSMMQLKVVQEVITLTVFTIISVVFPLWRKTAMESYRGIHLPCGSGVFCVYAYIEIKFPKIKSK